MESNQSEITKTASSSSTQNQSNSINIQNEFNDENDEFNTSFSSTTTVSLPNSKGNNAKKRRANLISQACAFCKERHLRCDGNLPCFQCKRRNKECQYVPSEKRGRKPKINTLEFTDNRVHYNVESSSSQPGSQIQDSFSHHSNSLNNNNNNNNSNNNNSNNNNNNNNNNISSSSTNLSNSRDLENYFKMKEELEITRSLAQYWKQQYEKLNSRLLDSNQGWQQFSFQNEAMDNVNIGESFVRASDYFQLNLRDSLSFTEVDTYAKYITKFEESVYIPMFYYCPLSINPEFNWNYWKRINSENYRGPVHELLEAFQFAIVCAHGSRYCLELNVSSYFMKKAETFFHIIFFIERLQSNETHVQTLIHLLEIMSFWYIGEACGDKASICSCIIAQIIESSNSSDSISLLSKIRSIGYKCSFTSNNSSRVSLIKEALKLASRLSNPYRMGACIYILVHLCCLMITEIFMGEEIQIHLLSCCSIIQESLPYITSNVLKEDSLVTVNGCKALLLSKRGRITEALQCAQACISSSSKSSLHLSVPCCLLMSAEVARLYGQKDLVSQVLYILAPFRKIYPVIEMMTQHLIQKCGFQYETQNNNHSGSSQSTNHFNSLQQSRQ